MADKRVNVLVYSGNGSTLESVKHCLWSLRRLLGPHYAVIPMTGETLLKEPWQSTCALFVMPGGADLGYCRTLNGQGNRLISAFVNKGGRYLGLCAGGYYGAARCEFEEGKGAYEVVGDRELAFYPGVCRGLAFPGFVYHSEAGTRAAEVKVNKEVLAAGGGGAIPEVFRTYYNGGGVFVDASKFKDKGIKVLASYTEKLHVEAGDDKAAVVYCKVGNGAAVLTGPHPEFAAVNLNSKGKDRPDYPRIVEALAADDKQRVDFMKAVLVKLGLQVNPDNQNVPSLSRLHISSAKISDITELMSSLTEVIDKEGEEEFIKGENDTFKLEKQTSSSFHLSSIAGALPEAIQNVLPESAKPDSEETKEAQDVKAKEAEEEATTDEGIVDYDAVVKRILPHESSIPEPKETPYFNHAAYFSSLLFYSDLYRLSTPKFGSPLLYGEVVTSTNTLLEKNPELLNHLPDGFTATATTQLAGRGRGNNVWVSPPGSLMFSTLVRHPIALSASAPVVFIQYITALAIVAGIQKYDSAYEDLPIKLKWPNDIYALDPKAEALGKTGRDKYVKIGGILVNSSYAGGDYTLVCGVGINVSNAAPTTSLNALAAAAGLPPFTNEKLLASILVQFEKLHIRFLKSGFSESMLDDYYEHWLHGEQIVTLETEGGQRAMIRGITRDWGLLVAEELGWEDRGTGRKWELQSDANSFDFFKGLVKRKT